MNDTITKDYKQTTRDVISDIDLENREIAGRLDIIDRMEQLSENCGYISIKDHKEDFRTNPKCRLINPAKNDMGKVSKQILQKINNEIRSKLDLNQWHSTQTVLDWFGMIKRKTVKRFFQLDIVDFYPSISETLLDEALTFAEAHASINDTEKDIIKQARKSLLFSQPTNNRNAAKIPWTKKSGLFDVTMGAADGAEVCELVGLLLLKEIQQEFSQYNMDFGLYRDDGLAAHSRIPPPQLDRIRKDMHKLFGKHGLKITMSQNCSLERVDFLDVTMNLPKESYEPYRKPNSTPQYVNVGSNHPPNVISQIPRSIEKRLSSISSSQEIFDAAAPPYQKALTDSGHNHTLTYNKQPPRVTDEATAHRKRNILWYNPPYNAAVTTSIGKKFLALVSKHFGKDHPLRPILNRNVVKISYSCTKNLKQILQSHNRKILQNSVPVAPDNNNKCNCRDEDSCPMDKHCLQGGIYKASFDHNGTTKIYIGSTINFKQRYGTHKFSFTHETDKNSTALSAYLWEHGLQNEYPRIKWEMLTNAPEYTKGGRQCDLCLTEKVYILKGFADPNQLNRRSDIALQCRHKKKHRLNQPIPSS